MKYALIAALFLTGCSVVPVKQKFPEVPQTLLDSCPKLEALKEDAKLSDVAKSVTNNYTLYHECSTKQEGFVEWYTTQKKIFEDVNK